MKNLLKLNLFKNDFNFPHKFLVIKLALSFYWFFCSRNMNKLSRALCVPGHIRSTAFMHCAYQFLIFAPLIDHQANHQFEFPFNYFLCSLKTCKIECCK